MMSTRRRGRQTAAGRTARIALGVLTLVVLIRPNHAIAVDRKPTAEQVTERTRGFAAVWESFRENVAGLKIRLEEELVSAGEFDGTSLTWLRTGVSLAGGTPITDALSLGIAPYFAWERLIVDDRGELMKSLAGRDARSTDFFDSGIRFGASYQLNEVWGGEFVTGFSARHESGANYDDAIQIGGSVAVTYDRGSWLSLRLGVGTGADLSDGKLRVSPVYRIQITPRPGWTLESSGLGGSIEWEATPRTTFSMGGGVDGTQYRLDQSPTGTGDATFQRRQARLELGFVHRLNDLFRLRAGIGIVLDEELSLVLEDAGEVESRHNRDPSATLTFGVDIRI